MLEGLFSLAGILRPGAGTCSLGIPGGQTVYITVVPEGFWRRPFAQSDATILAILGSGLGLVSTMVMSWEVASWFSVSDTDLTISDTLWSWEGAGDRPTQEVGFLSG